MATITTFTKGQVLQGVATNTSKTVAEAEIDFSKKACKSGDVVQVLRVPAGALMTHAAAIVTKVEGSTATADLGDATTAAGWVAALNLNALGAYLPLGHTTGAYVADGGVYFSKEGVLLLTLKNDVSTAKVTIVAEYSILDKKYLS